MDIRGIFYGLLTFLFVFFSTATAVAVEYYMPTAAHYEAATQAKSCSVFRSLHRDAERKIASNKRLIKKHIFSLKQARTKLEACARERGVRLSRNGDGEQEVLIAELCPSLYKAWLTPSYRVKMVAEDLQEAYQTSRVTRTQLKVRCRKLPEDTGSKRDESAAIQTLKRLRRSSDKTAAASKPVLMKVAALRSAGRSDGEIATNRLGGF